jgi:hypothetical protein
MTDWMSAVGILSAGLVVGLMFAIASWKQRGRATGNLELSKLEAKRDAILERLRTLEDGEDGDRDRLEREAAAVLRQLDQLRQSPAADHVAVPVPAVRRPVSSVYGFLFGAGVVAIAGSLVFYATKPAATAAERVPSMQQSAMVPSPIPVARDTDDVEARIVMARECLDREDMVGAFEHTKFVLARKPGEPRAQTYQAIVRLAMGQPDAAKGLLLSATTTDPKFTEAWVALAWLNTKVGDAPAAVRAIDSAVLQHPEDEQRLRGALVEMQKGR